MKEPDSPRALEAQQAANRELADAIKSNPGLAARIKRMEQMSGVKAKAVPDEPPNFTEDQLRALEKAEQRWKRRDRLLLIAVIAIVLFLSIGWGMGWLHQ